MNKHRRSRLNFTIPKENANLKFETKMCSERKPKQVQWTHWHKTDYGGTLTSVSTDYIKLTLTQPIGNRWSNPWPRDENFALYLLSYQAPLGKKVSLW